MQADQPLHTPAKKNCTFKVDGRQDGEGYLNKNDSKFGVIVIQEWWGLNESMVKTTDRIAQKGFQCISPDIYRGKVAQNREEAGHLLGGLDWEGAVKDIEGAAKHLKELGCTKVGVTGFCMGGALAIASISFSNQIDASAPFYGVCDLNTFKLENIHGPIYGHFGEKDEMKGFSSPDDAQRLVDAGTKAGKDVTVKVWPGVGHAFMNQDRPEAYNPEISQQALDEVTNWFRKIFTS
ncbi:unnamed protein product [Paramecium sonneborni]|uniref:Dienelactone hydrolase domain-containing protein n=1 Tax=Paramecium sonneborni TaxID=65129 RepID=A0A8S1R8H4_9CILI|nr:unnamed protein product [Paramecium sonneborni]